MTFTSGRNSQSLVAKALMIAISALTALAMVGCSDGAQAEAGEDIRFSHYATISYQDGLDTVVDRETGVVYLRWWSSQNRNAVGGITPLLDGHGQPQVIPNPDEAIAESESAERDGTAPSGEERFRRYELSERGVNSVIDTETGVVYLCWRSSQNRNAVGGITPLIGNDGKPTIDTGYLATLGD